MTASRVIARVGCRVLLCFAALGAATTLVVAWLVPVGLTAAGFAPHSPGLRELWSDKVSAGVYWHSKLMFSEQVTFQPRNFPPDPLPTDRGAPPPWTHTLTRRGLALIRPEATSWTQVDTWVVGWPFRAFSGAYYEPDVVRTVSQLGPTAALPKPRRVGLITLGEPWGVIPMDPMYRGLALDLGVYAVLWGLLWVAGRHARRTLRRRLGRCAACNYDLEGLDQSPKCPECGLIR